MQPRTAAPAVLAARQSSVWGNAWISGNTILEGPGRGIRASSTGNRIDGNHLAQNGFGIEVTGSRNLIVRNSPAPGFAHRGALAPTGGASVARRDRAALTFAA